MGMGGVRGEVHGCGREWALKVCVAVGMVACWGVGELRLARVCVG